MDTSEQYIKMCDCEEIISEAVCKWCTDLLSNHTLERLSACNECLKQDWREYWSKTKQIFYTGGWGWGVTPEGLTVCLGKEAELAKGLQGKRVSIPPEAPRLTRRGL